LIYSNNSSNWQSKFFRLIDDNNSDIHNDTNVNIGVLYFGGSGMNSNNTGAESMEIPIISFCTDIKESVQAIEIDGEKAFNQYCYYIDNVADFYINQLEATEAELFRSNLWVPGDALWGVANSKSGASLKDDIMVIFSRIVASIAHGLAVTNIWSNEQEIPPLYIRAAAFYGQIFKKLLSRNYPLYNGRCLNVCGRIQEKVKPNSLALGFIISRNDDSVKQKLDFFNIELPEIEFNSMKDQIRKMLQPNQLEKYGCSIKFNTVTTAEHKLLLHFATYPTKELKGLEDTIIIITNVEFQIDKASKVFKVECRDAGPSYRREYEFASFETINLADLIIDNKLDYLTEIYNGDNNLIFKYDKINQNFTLEFTGSRISPRVNANRELMKKRVIDFSKDKYCVLPVYKTNKPAARDKAILVFVKNTDNEKAIVFTEIPSSKIYNIKNYNSYYDMADLCIKLKLRD
jgi:hypothetical protein